MNIRKYIKKVFNHITDFGYQRNFKEAVGFYIITLIFIIGFAFLMAIILAFLLNPEKLMEVMETWWYKIAILYVTTVSFLILRAKKLIYNYKYIILLILPALITYFYNIFVGLLFTAGLTILPINNKLIKNWKKQILIGIAKFFIAVFIFLFVFGAVIPGILNLFWGKDIPPVEDSDLMLNKVSVADDNNMFFELRQISKMEIYEPNNINFVKEYLNSDTWDEGLANVVFEKNKEALNLWGKASQKDEFLFPNMSNPDAYSIDMTVDNMIGWYSISRISNAYAIWLVHNGKNQESINQAIKSIKIGDAVIKSRTHALGYLTGLRIKNSGLEALQKIIAITNGKDINKQKLLSDLNNYNNQNENYSLFKIEYIAGKKLLKTLPEYIKSDPDYFNTLIGRLLVIYLSNKFYFKPNETISYHADFARHMTEKLKKPCSELMPYKIPYSLNTNSALGWVQLYFTENVIGKLLFARFGIFPLDSLFKRTCDIQTKQQEIYKMVESL